jgi:putative Mn2+ efflux pump MntP
MVPLGPEPDDSLVTDVSAMIALLLAAAAVSAGNLAAAASIGAVESDREVRARLVSAFAIFEGGMPVVGVLLGENLSRVVSVAAKPLAGTALASVGLYVLFASTREPPDGRHPLATNCGIIATSAVLSIDNLVVGDALGTAGVSLQATAATFGGMAIVIALVGLRLGSVLNSETTRTGEVVAGALLVALGVATAAAVV